MDESKDEAELERMIEEAAHDSRYWHSRTPEERLQALELLRQKAYGYDPATAKIRRVIQIVKLTDI